MMVSQNGILVALRAGHPTSDVYEMLLVIDSAWGAQFSFQEREHATSVIERLISLKRIHA